MSISDSKISLANPAPGRIVNFVASKGEGVRPVSSGESGTDGNGEESSSMAATRAQRSTMNSNRNNAFSPNGDGPDDPNDAKGEGMKPHVTGIPMASQNNLWALPIFVNGRGVRIVVHVNAKANNTDYSLFTKFREKYFLVSSRWQRLTQLRAVTKIQCVRVSCCTLTV
jgi:hypothetical protein